MIDKEKIIKWKKSIEHIKGLYGYVTESDDLLLQFCEQYLSGKLVEPMSESEIIKEISSIRSRIVEIRDSLIGDDNRKGYGLDEWSPPCENLSYLIKKIDGLAQSIVGKVGK